MKHSRTELSHLKPDHYDMLKDSYIVGGIWVMNLRKIRADGLESKMLDVVKDDTIVKRWNDQDIVNIACGGKVAFLPLNYISYPYLPGLLRDPSFTSHYSRDELYDSFINPKIIHYASVKPWNGAPVRGDEWWAVHDYLRLPERAGIDYSRETPLEKRYRKMKKRPPRKKRTRKAEKPPPVRRGAARRMPRPKMHLPPKPHRLRQAPRQMRPPHRRKDPGPRLEENLHHQKP